MRYIEGLFAFFPAFLIPVSFVISLLANISPRICPIHNPYLYTCSLSVIWYKYHCYFMKYCIVRTTPDNICPTIATNHALIIVSQINSTKVLDLFSTSSDHVNLYHCLTQWIDFLPSFYFYVLLSLLFTPMLSFYLIFRLSRL